ncbi:MAG: cyclodeaminase/cyclohydrolase family protein, partial [Stomatobaculum sp.]|nr:cyclodeaminase/cyclohydrolase family protein [Stomatobaculum sp.]
STVTPRINKESTPNGDDTNTLALSIISDTAKLEVEKLADVMDRDTDAFLMVSDAYALPKATDEEKAARSLAIQEGLKACTRTPLEMMELMGEAVELMASMMDGFNTNCASDLGVAALSLKAGILGAWLNVKINTGSLKDKAFAADAEARGQAVLDRAVPAAEDCFAGLLKMVEE